MRGRLLVTSALETGSFDEHPEGNRKEDDSECDKYPEAEHNVHVRDAEESVAKRVHHIKDWVEERNRSPWLWKQ